MLNIEPLNLGFFIIPLSVDIPIFPTPPAERVAKICFLFFHIATKDTTSNIVDVVYIVTGEAFELSIIFLVKFITKDTNNITNPNIAFITYNPNKFLNTLT